MEKDKINEYTLLNGKAETFENVFSEENPWNLDSIQEQYRYRLVINFIKKCFDKPGLNILEIGCAEGNFSEYLSKENYKTTAIDISETAIERAKNKALADIEFICSDMVDFIQNENIESYDVILIMECYYYLGSERRNVFLKELAKKINPSAYIILTTPIRRKNIMFPAESRLISTFKYRGFENMQSFGNVILSMRGSTGKVLELIPTSILKKFFIFIHKIFFPFRINQKLFVFKKNK